ACCWGSTSRLSPSRNRTRRGEKPARLTSSRRIRCRVYRIPCRVHRTRPTHETATYVGRVHPPPLAKMTGELRPDSPKRRRRKGSWTRLQRLLGSRRTALGPRRL